MTRPKPNSGYRRAIVYTSKRPNCPAYGHDTIGAFRRHGCRCFRAVAAEALMRTRYYERRNTGQEVIYRRHPAHTSDHVVKCLTLGLDPGCKPIRVEIQEAIRLLLIQGLTLVQIAERVGVSRRCVQDRSKMLKLSERDAREATQKAIKDAKNMRELDEL